MAVHPATAVSQAHPAHPPAWDRLQATHPVWALPQRRRTPGMQQAQSPATPRPGGLPPNFAPPAGMPNINFSAPVIRLGTTGPGRGPEPVRRDTNAEPMSAGGRRGLGMGSDYRGTEQQRQQIRDSMMALQPPTREEIARTIFVGNITEGVGGDQGLERILRTAGSLRRWTRATDADNKPCRFGFAEYEDAESLETAAAIFRDVEVPLKRQEPKAKQEMDGAGEENGEVEKAKLLVVVDEASMKYAEEWKERRNESESASEFRIDTARESLQSVLRSLFRPVPSARMDQDGDVAMADGEPKSDATAAEVITIPLSAEDELSDIPAEMRETVAAEIAAFRDRSNRRDLERLRREEEAEALERQRGGRANRLASPLPTAPSGPGGANGIPLGPRERGVVGAPSGPKAFQGSQVPKDYQGGVTFVNGSGINGAASAGWINREDEDSDASDEELERRRQEKKEAELEKIYLDYERRWLNRERSRTAAVEREKARDKDEEAVQSREKDAVAKRLKEWNDDVEAQKKTEEYYVDRSLWIRNRMAFRAREAEADDRDRANEDREKAREEQKREQARGMADSFLDRQAEELGSRVQTPREPARFKMSLGTAAAQKAQAAAPKRRTIAEVEGLLEDEEEADTTTRRTLVPIKFDTAAEAAGLTDEERQEAAKQLAGDIPTDKEGLWNWPIKWEFVDDTVLTERLKPFVEKKIVEYLGVQEQMLVDVVEGHIRKRGGPDELIGELEGALDEEAEVLVKKLWLSRLTSITEEEFKDFKDFKDFKEFKLHCRSDQRYVAFSESDRSSRIPFVTNGTFSA
ncbi:hypothetical protein H2199_008189 [Coniosporium tulheliwenetii]|uniref:Uncharacterized protein n=1 Tax=Coniosporium tulheliwenetii TaxID=3383036 RepID=A0ACC2YKM8_9PEZI|nr:hypothetical protein H2199_008189 [Cladosporium sp. JES 115]